jgi:hypothetical protein
MSNFLVQTNETLILGQVPNQGRAFLRLAEPELIPVLIPETRLVLEPIRVELLRLVKPEQSRAWLEARYIIKEFSSAEGLIEALEFGARLQIPLRNLPVGMPARVAQLPTFEGSYYRSWDWQLNPNPYWRRKLRSWLLDLH